MSRRFVGGLVLEPDLLWFKGKFRRNLKLKCSADGRIEYIGASVPGTHPTLRLANQALLPGMVNSHSHAFHRGLRDINESGGDFWAWRQVFYRMVEEMTEDQFYDVCSRAFTEMLRSGITSVGEFHYFHHGCRRDEDTPPENLFSFDPIVLKAARDVGIRITLLQTYYEQSGLDGSPLQPAQKHFACKSVDEFWANFEQMSHQLHGPTQKLGVAAHSIRGVSLENIMKLHTASIERKVPFHIHLEEQPLEIEDCKKKFGKEPSSVLLQSLALDPSFTVVHATHTSPENFRSLAEKGVNFSICPLTEGCLADGIPNWPEVPFHVSLGSDCNNRICMAEEMRWLCYLQQVKTGRRGLPGYDDLCQGLFEAATKGGARSLGLDHCGELKVGNWCDFFTLDLSAHSLQNAADDSLMKAFIFGSASDAVVNSVCVAGDMQSFWELADPPHTASDEPKSESLTEISGDKVDDLLMSMMSIDSTSGKEQNVASALGQYLSRIGWNVEENHFGKDGRFNVIATMTSSMSEVEVILNTHFDTVPPFIPPTTVKDQTIYGRGACDAKGVLAAMVFGAGKFIAGHPKLASKIALIFVAGEEVDHVGALAVSKLGFRPKAVICGEPTENQLVNFQKGMLKVNLKCSGKAGHSGYPHIGESAVEKLLDILQDIREHPWPTDEEFGATTINFGIINGGVAANVIPGHADATLAIRLITSPDDIIARITKIVAGRCEVEEVSRSHPIKMTIKGDKPYPVPFNTDLGYLGLDPEVERCLVGPGVMTSAHGPNEYMDIKELYAAVDIYHDILCRYFGV